MTEWQALRLEYMLARRQHGWRKALQIATKAAKAPPLF